MQINNEHQQKHADIEFGLWLPESLVFLQSCLRYHIMSLRNNMETPSELNVTLINTVTKTT